MMDAIVRWSVWPAVAGASAVGTHLALREGWTGDSIIPVVFLSTATVLAGLERAFPHEARWNQEDHELHHDVVFTLFGSGLGGAVGQLLVLTVGFCVARLLTGIVDAPAWPRAWPLPLQIALTLIVADLGAYAGHRAFHRWPGAWPFHAVHHAVRRLSWINSGRVHPVDAAFMIVCSLPLLLVLGAPPEMMTWLGVATTVIGLLSHCNVDMSCGALDWIFNTPSVHRWHHAPEPEVGDVNFGENTMIWDLVFGTHSRRAERPPVDVGTSTPVPRELLAQLSWPLQQASRGRLVRRAGLSLLALSVGLSAAPALAERHENAAEVVNRLHATLLDNLHRSEELGYAGRLAAVEQVLPETFDLRFMASRSVGPQWRDWTDAEKTRWVDLFGRVTAANYARLFRNSGTASFRTLETEPVDSTAIVWTELHENGDPPTELGYRMRRTVGGWRIIDVYVDGGLSELSIRRSQYVAELARAGYAGLVAAAEKKLAGLAKDPS